MTFILNGEDPKLATIVETSDFQYAVTTQFKVLYHIDLTIKENVDNTLWSITFQFQYMRSNYENLEKAIHGLCRYVNSKGAALDPIIPPAPAEPETKPWEQEKSSSYGQGSVTQPYHSPAQIAAAAQGTLHPSFHVGNQHNVNYHQGGPNGIYHQNPNVQHNHPNGYQGHPQQHQNYGRGYGGMPNPNFGGNRGATNGNRHGGQHHPGLYQPGYPSAYQTGGRGGNHHMGGDPRPYNAQQYINNTGAQNGYQQRRFHNPPTPTTGDSSSVGNGGYMPRTAVGQSPLDTLSSIELPDSGNVNGNGYRPHQDGRTLTPNGSPYSPTGQSYFPPQPSNVHHNGYPHNQGYPGGRYSG